MGSVLCICFSLFCIFTKYVYVLFVVDCFCLSCWVLKIYIIHGRFAICNYIITSIEILSQLWELQTPHWLSSASTCPLTKCSLSSNSSADISCHSHKCTSHRLIGDWFCWTLVTAVNLIESRITRKMCLWTFLQEMLLILLIEVGRSPTLYSTIPLLGSSTVYMEKESQAGTWNHPSVFPNCGYDVASLFKLLLPHLTSQPMMDCTLNSKINLPSLKLFLSEYFMTATRGENEVTFLL